MTKECNNLDKWERIAAEHSSLRSEELDLCRKYILIPVLKEMIGLGRKRMALDIGCGMGYFVEILSQAGYKSRGFDFSPKMIENAKKKHKFCDYFIQDLKNKLIEKNNSYDLVTSILVFHNIGRNIYKRALKEIYRILKRDGRLIIVIPHPNFLSEFSNLIGNYHLSYITETNSTYIWKNDTAVCTDFYTRSTSFYLNSVIEAGFKINKVVEPVLKNQYKNHFPGEYHRKKEMPGFLILECEK